jgi:hypothetical protein
VKHYRIYLVFVLIILISTGTFAQRTYTTTSKRAISFYEEGKKQYRLKYMEPAEELLLKAIKTDESFLEPYMVIAELYWETKQYEKAIEMYNTGISINPEFYPTAYSNKGQLEMRIGWYVQARESFGQYLVFNPQSTKRIKEAKRGIQQAEFALKAMENPVPYDPIRLSAAINSEDDEYWPTLSADARTLVFTRLVGSKEGVDVQEDFYVSKFDSDRWLPAQDVGQPLNTYDNEGAQTISANGKFMVYTVCNRPGVIGRCDLFYSEKFGNEWSEPKNMGEPINTPHKETQPTLSSDGRTLYFACDKPGGYGKLDLYVSRMGPDGIWSKPENLGDSINTVGYESSPFIHHDNNTLYFSSNYHLGFGGFDIFYARKNVNGKWGTPVNIGYPINTHRDEIGLIINAKGNMAYFSSDIFKNTGKDIYQFELYEKARPAEVSYLHGKVFNARNRQALKANFELYNLSDGSLVTKSFSDYRNGEFLVCLPTNNNYMLNVSREGYLFYSENFSLEGVFHIEEPFHKDIPLRELLKGNTIILKNVFFETADYTLKPESETELDKIVKFLSENPELKIEISGHTDNEGGETYNLQLSKQRAESVVQYLQSKGVQDGRMVSKGYGYTQPVETNDTPEGRAQNRRTELKVL